MLLYGEYAFVSVIGAGQRQLHIGPMARLLRIPNSRVRDYLEFLKARDLLIDLAFTRGLATLTLKFPKGE